MKATAIDHICIAVENLDKAKIIYREILGKDPDVEYIADSEKINVARYYIGEVALELMESTTPDGDVAKFINKRGEGVFLISYKVDDVEAKLSDLKSKGNTLIDDKPRSLFGNKYAFIMPPNKTCCVLTEIIDGYFDHEK